jgi:hypothetical protein
VLFVLTAGLLLNGCEADRYQWNLKHAEITRGTHLPHGDFEDIVRVVTHATNEPILWIEGSAPQVAVPTRSNGVYRHQRQYALIQPSEGRFRLAYHLKC